MLIKWQNAENIRMQDTIIFNSSDFVTRQIIYKSNATTIEVIYSDTLRNIILPYYEYERQEQIADYLEKQCNSFNALIADIQEVADI